MLRLQFDDRDKRAFAALDDNFTVSGNGEVVVISGAMVVEVTRLAGDGGDQFRLRIGFPGEPLDINIRRSQLLEQLGIGDDNSSPHDAQNADAGVHLFEAAGCPRRSVPVIRIEGRRR